MNCARPRAQNFGSYVTFILASDNRWGGSATCWLIPDAPCAAPLALLIPTGVRMDCSTLNQPASVRFRRRRYDRLMIRPTLASESYVELDEALPIFLPRRQVDIICFSIIDWSFRYQRPQQIMSQFAAHGHRVFYINLSQFLPLHSTLRVQVRPLKENVYDVSVTAARPPQIYRESVQGLNLNLCLESLDALREAFQIDEAVSYVMSVAWGEVAMEARRRWGWSMVYDCMDEWENFPGVSSTLVKMEPQVVKECDLLVVTAAKLYDKWKPLNRPMVLARNGVDYDAYVSRLEPNAMLEGVQHPIIGYFGGDC